MHIEDASGLPCTAFWIEVIYMDETNASGVHLFNSGEVEIDIRIQYSPNIFVYINNSSHLRVLFQMMTFVLVFHSFKVLLDFPLLNWKKNQKIWRNSFILFLTTDKKDLNIFHCEGILFPIYYRKDATSCQCLWRLVHNCSISTEGFPQIYLLWSFIQCENNERSVSMSSAHKKKISRKHQIGLVVPLSDGFVHDSSANFTSFGIAPIRKRNIEGRKQKNLHPPFVALSENDNAVM